MGRKRLLWLRGRDMPIRDAGPPDEFDAQLSLEWPTTSVVVMAESVDQRQTTSVPAAGGEPNRFPEGTLG